MSRIRPAASVAAPDAQTLEQLAANCRNQGSAIAAWRLGHALLKAKTRMKHGQFKAWLEEMCPEPTYPTLARYMKLAKAYPKQEPPARRKLIKIYQAKHIAEDGVQRRAKRRALIREAANLCGEALQLARGEKLRQMLAKLDRILHELLPKKRWNR